MTERTDLVIYVDFEKRVGRREEMAARKKAITREKLLDIARAHFARFGE